MTAENGQSVLRIWITAFTDAGQTYIMDQVAPMLRDDPSGAL